MMISEGLPLSIKLLLSHYLNEKSLLPTVVVKLSGRVGNWLLHIIKTAQGHLTTKEISKLIYGTIKLCFLLNGHQCSCILSDIPLLINKHFFTFNFFLFTLQKYEAT